MVLKTYMLKPLHHENVMTFVTNQPLIEGGSQNSVLCIQPCMAAAKEVPYKCTCTLGANAGFNCTLHDQCLWFQSEIEDFFISTSYRQFQDRHSLYIAMHAVFARMIY